MAVDTGAPLMETPLMETWFSAEVRSAGNARYAVRRCLGATDLRLVEEVELLTSELFAQAAEATQEDGRVCVRVRQTGSRVHVEVAHESTDDGRPALAARDPLAGAILDRLLDAFATRWGRHSGAQHGATWFETSLAR